MCLYMVQITHQRKQCMSMMCVLHTNSAHKKLVSEQVNLHYNDTHVANIRSIATVAAYTYYNSLSYLKLSQS